jgi:hypothetical protein
MKARDILSGRRRPNQPGHGLFMRSGRGCVFARFQPRQPRIRFFPGNMLAVRLVCGPRGQRKRSFASSRSIYCSMASRISPCAGSLRAVARRRRRASVAASSSRVAASDVIMKGPVALLLLPT